MNKVEIYINDPSNYTLDVGDFDMSFNYSFNDIRDITKRNGSFSKTLTLPGTKNNNISSIILYKAKRNERYSFTYYLLRDVYIS